LAAAISVVDVTRLAVAGAPDVAGLPAAPLAAPARRRHSHMGMRGKTQERRRHAVERRRRSRADTRLPKPALAGDANEAQRPHVGALQCRRYVCTFDASLCLEQYLALLSVMSP
jgi:hypothetical protein